MIPEQVPEGRTASFDAISQDGSQLMNSAGSLLTTVKAMKAEWFKEHGNHLNGVFNEELKGKILELEGIVAELQAKIQALKKLAQEKGLGDQIEDLLKEAGLDPVVKIRVERFGCRAIEPFESLNDQI